MKILFVSPVVSYSEQRPFKDLGSESVIYGLSKEMAARGHSVYITGLFTDFGGEDRRVIDGIQFVNIKIPNLRDEVFYQLGSALLYSRETARKIEEIAPNVICLNERFSAYFPSKLNIPKIFTTHNPDGMAFYKQFAVRSHFLNYLLFPFKRIVEEIVMRNSDIIIVLNKTVEDYLNTLGFLNTCIIPDAINVEEYSNKGEDNFILYAGGLRKVKGINYLIEAFSKIAHRYDIDLLLVGSGPEERDRKSVV